MCMQGFSVIKVTWGQMTQITESEGSVFKDGSNKAIALHVKNHKTANISCLKMLK